MAAFPFANWRPVTVAVIAKAITRGWTKLLSLNMKKGFLDYWNRMRAWGFAVDETGARYFVHISAFEPPFPVGTHPVQGTYVIFEEGRTVKGPCAVNVQIVKPSAAGVEEALKSRVSS